MSYISILRNEQGSKVGEIVSVRVAGVDPGIFLGGGAPLRNRVADW